MSKLSVLAYLFITLLSLNAYSGRPPEAVSDLVWRSGRPSAADYKTLVANDIKVIINLENNPPAIKKDADLAKKSGMIFYSFPIDTYSTPDDNQINQILDILKNTKVKALVHCFHGEDRTGLIIGLERVLIENWQPETAYQEMLDKNFHQKFSKLDDYFRYKTSNN